METVADIYTYLHLILFFTGVANFNGQHGCLKCTTVGEYSYRSNTNIFPRLDCPKRTDAEFRQKKYGGHHKCDSPLLRLDIDMIEQFPIGDSLHLLHLGVMKRMLFGWRDGTFRNSGTKWPARTSVEISAFLTQCKVPREINRPPRGLEELSHWKGTEYRTFLMYVGIVALKDHVSFEVYQHFLLLFCAITICESNHFSHMLPLAKMMLNDYLEQFRDIYGEHYITSNFHNLTHLVDDVMKFGVLQSFSSYPFESMLGHLKRMIRNGRLPLSQLARRIKEMSQLNICTGDTESSKEAILTLPNNGKNVPAAFRNPKSEFFSRIDFGDFSLSTDMPNKWFLTEKGEIVGLECILSQQKNVSLFGRVITNHKDFFDCPVKSRHLNIYASEYFDDKSNENLLSSVANVKCKLVRIIYNDNTDVYVPLLHTIRTK